MSDDAVLEAREIVRWFKTSGGYTGRVEAAEQLTERIAAAIERERKQLGAERAVHTTTQAQRDEAYIQVDELTESLALERAARLRAEAERDEAVRTGKYGSLESNRMVQQQRAEQAEQRAATLATALRAAWEYETFNRSDCEACDDAEGRAVSTYGDGVARAYRFCDPHAAEMTAWWNEAYADRALLSTPEGQP